jgi:hypothetical protein
VSRVHCAGPRSSSADSSPAASRARRPGGAGRLRRDRGGEVEDGALAADQVGDPREWTH